MSVLRPIPVYGRALARLGCVAAVVCGIGLVSHAQDGISISFSNFDGSLWPAGPDFATDVLSDPWDMNNAEDLGLDPAETRGWANFSIGGGHAGGATSSNDTQMSLLYRGRWGIVNPGRTGRSFPIDPGVYPKLSFKMSDSVGAGDNPQVYWFHYPWADPAVPASDPTATGYGVKLLGPTVPGDQIYVTDLTQNLTDGLPWQSGAPVRGLRLDPNGQNVGQTVFFSWVRLTANDYAPGSAMQTFNWSGGSGDATVDVIDAGGTVVHVAGGVGGTSVGWNYGILPPGNYTVRVTRGGASGTRAFTINSPPLIQVTDPNDTGGEDFATKVLGNPWDMDGPIDVRVSGSDGYTPVPAIFSGGVMTATNTNGDANVTLVNNANNGTPIDTSRYHYLTVRFQIDAPFDLALGSVARWFWNSQTNNPAQTVTTTKDIEVWPGMNSYTIDLWQLDASPDGGLEASGGAEPWAQGQKRFLRFDPHEFVDPHTFHIDDVKLAAMAETVNNHFTIRWTGSDGDGTNAAVSLYFDNDTNPAGKVLIQSGLTLNQGSFDWNTSSVPAGTYYIYAEANDGVQTYGRYSAGTVRVIKASGGSSPVMSLDSPATNTTVSQPFNAAGWAVDLGAADGPGVSAVHVYAFPVINGVVGAGTFLGAATLGFDRGDIAGAFGGQFLKAGFKLQIAGLGTGQYYIGAYALSTVTGTFNQQQLALVSVSEPHMSLDGPANNSSISQPFITGGWAVDLGAPTGTGVDAVHVWAFPLVNGSIGGGIFVAEATLGGFRPDVGAAFGGQFNNAGFNFLMTGLSPGQYYVGVYVHSALKGVFDQQQFALVTILQ